MEPCITIKKLWKLFGDNPERVISRLSEDINLEKLQSQNGLKAAVSDVTLSISSGEIFVVMGLSGSGKSTLLRMINGLITPTAGDIAIDGKSLIQLPSSELHKLRRTKMAMVFQSFALFPQRTTLENAAFGLEIAGVPRRKRLEKAREALERVGLGNDLDKLPKQLSGGMQQRVGIARALAIDPPILLMDEAFSALDPLIRREMQEQLLELQAERPRTIVFVSHDLDEAVRVGDRIALMENGKVLQCDSPKQLLCNPENQKVRDFFKHLDPSSVITVDAIAVTPSKVAQAKDLEKMKEGEISSSTVDSPTYIIDDKGIFKSLIKENGEVISSEKCPLLKGDTTIHDAIETVVNAPYPIPVIAKDQRFIGVISPTLLLRSITIK